MQCGQGQGTARPEQGCADRAEPPPPQWDRPVIQWWELFLSRGARPAPSAVAEVREERSPELLERLPEGMAPGLLGHLHLEGAEFGLELGALLGEFLPAPAQRQAEMTYGIDTGAVEGTADGHDNHRWEMVMRGPEHHERSSGPIDWPQYPGTL